MQPMTARVREATLHDWPTVAALLAELGRPDVRGTPAEREGQRIYARYLERPDTVALVAELDGQVVGFMDVELRTWLNFTSPQAWTPDLVVADGARGRGVGGALLARAEEIARDKGCWSMALESATWRERAHAFYRSHGWQETGRAFIKLLTDVRWPPAPPSS